MIAVSRFKRVYLARLINQPLTRGAAELYGASRNKTK